MDGLTPERRSWNMSQVHSRDTSIELAVRHWLYHHGYRYRKNVKQLPGKPDIVLRPYKTVIFIHGCFWHRHPGCRDATTPKTNTEFWENKFARNVANDIKHRTELEELGFRVIVIWECDINKNLEKTMTSVAEILGQPR